MTEAAAAAREKLTQTICDCTAQGTEDGAFKQFKTSREFAVYIADAILAAFPQLAPGKDAPIVGPMFRGGRHSPKSITERQEAGTAPGKDVVEGARAVAAEHFPFWFEGTVEEYPLLAEHVTNVIANFATAHAAEESERHRAEVERLTRERDEARYALVDEKAAAMSGRFKTRVDRDEAIKRAEAAESALAAAQSVIAQAIRETNSEAEAAPGTDYQRGYDDAMADIRETLQSAGIVPNEVVWIVMHKGQPEGVYLSHDAAEAACDDENHVVRVRAMLTAAAKEPGHE